MGWWNCIASVARSCHQSVSIAIVPLLEGMDRLEGGMKEGSTANNQEQRTTNRTRAVAAGGSRVRACVRASVRAYLLQRLARIHPPVKQP